MLEKIALVLIAALAATAAAPRSASAQAFIAHLTGDEEVPPVETRSVGQAAVVVTPREVLHSVSVGNIEDVVAAHVHCAPEGVNGPVGITLFSGDTVGSGNLARGPLPDPDPGNNCGWATLDDALDAIASGGAYVNVHTAENPGGEVRGQLR